MPSSNPFDAAFASTTPVAPATGTSSSIPSASVSKNPFDAAFSTPVQSKNNNIIPTVSNSSTPPSLPANITPPPDTSNFFSKTVGGIKTFLGALGGNMSTPVASEPSYQASKSPKTATVDGITAPIKDTSNIFGGGPNDKVIGTGIKGSDLVNTSTTLDTTSKSLAAQAQSIKNMKVDKTSQVSIDNYNNAVNSYNTQANQFKSDVATYNKNVGDYNTGQTFINNINKTHDADLAFYESNKQNNGFAQILENSFIPTQFAKMGSSIVGGVSSQEPNQLSKEVIQKYTEEHPVGAVVAQGLGQLANIILIGKIGGGFGLASDPATGTIGGVEKAIGPGLTNLYPTLTRMLGNAASTGSIFGISNFLTEAIQQGTDQQLNAGKLAAKTAEGIGIGAATGPAQSFASTVARVSAMFGTGSGLTTLATYIQNGKITEKDLPSILVNGFILAGFEAVDGAAKTDFMKTADMNSIAKEQTIVTIMSNHPEMSRAEATQISSLIDNLSYIAKSAYYQKMPASYEEAFSNLPDLSNGSTEIKSEYFKQVADEVTNGKTLAQAITDVNSKPFISASVKKEVAGIIAKHGSDAAIAGLQSKGVTEEHIPHIINAGFKINAQENLKAGLPQKDSISVEAPRSDGVYMNEDGSKTTVSNEGRVRITEHSSSSYESAFQKPTTPQLNPKVQTVFNVYRSFDKSEPVENPDRLVPTGLKVSSETLKITGIENDEVSFTNKSLKHLAEKGDIGQKIIDKLPEILHTPDVIRKSNQEGRYLISKELPAEKGQKPHTITLEVTKQDGHIIVTGFPGRPNYLEKFQVLWRAAVSPSQQGLPQGGSSRVSALTAHESPQNNSEGSVANSKQAVNSPHINENLEGGFIAPNEIIKSLNNAGQSYIKNTLRPVKLSKDISESFYKLQGEQQATLEVTAKEINNFDISAQDNQQVYRYGENPAIETTAEQKEAYKKLAPILKIDEQLTDFIKAKGFPIPGDEEPFEAKEDIRGLRYMPRTPKNTPSVLQRIFDPVEGKPATSSQGGILSRSTASLKSRVYKALVNPNNHNDVKIVAEKDGKMTEIRDKGKASTDLGPTKQSMEGKTHAGGVKGDRFVDNNLNEWVIGHATSDEITDATGQEYYQDAVSSVLLRHAKLAQIARGIEFTNEWKASPEFAEISRPATEVPPPGWKPTINFNFRNYSFEPRTAEVLDDMQQALSGGNYNDAFSGMNNVLADAIFFNGLAHPINVLSTWVYNRGVSGFIPGTGNITRGMKAFSRALTALQTKNEDYLELLRNAAHLMSSDVNNKTVAEKLQKKFNQDLNDLPVSVRDKIITSLEKIGGQFTFKGNIVYKFSHYMAWLSNDLFTATSIFEIMDKDGISMANAVKETARFIPDYRQKSRLLDKPLSAIAGERGGNTARTLSRLMYNKQISMFGSYHVGLLQSLANSLKDTASFGKGFGKESNKTRARGADKLAMLAILGLIVYPWFDKKAKEITGNSNTYVTRSGIEKYPYLFYQALTGKATPTQALTGVITPAVATQAIIEMGFNRDLFTGNNIYGIGGEGAGGFLLNKVAPIAEANKVIEGKLTPGGLAATLIGVHSPKNTQIGEDLDSMIYTEKPQVDTQVKALVAEGKTKEALQTVIQFNDKLKTIMRQADIAGGNSGSDARIQFFLKTNGLKMPSVKVMQNYTKNAGKNIIQKVLPRAN